MKTRNPVSLAHYLSVGNLYLVMLPLLFVGAWGFFAFDRAMRSSIVSANAASASVVAGRLDEFFQRPEGALDGVETLLLKQDVFSRDRLGEYLDALLATYHFLDQIQIIDASGRVVWTAPDNPSMLGVSRLGETVYEKIQSTSGIYWSPSYISLKRERVAVSFGVRTGDYTILCDLNLGEVGRFATIPPQLGRIPVEIRVTDEQGVYVSHYDQDRVLRRERMPNFPTFRDLGGSAAQGIEIPSSKGSQIVSFARLQEPSWYVFVLYPTAALLRTMLGYYLGFAVILIAALSFGLILAYLRTRKIRVSLRQISEKAERISDGLYEELDGFGEDFVELRDVGASFDSMVDGIRRREEALLERERGFREILENIRLVSLSVDLDGRIVFANPYFLHLGGYTWQELAQQRLDRFVSVNGSSAGPFSHILDGATTESGGECRLELKDGSSRLIDWTITATRDAEGNISGATGIGTDITESKRQREIIEGSLREKEVLLKEVHHRVKNNLQLITSLLSLQEREDGDPSDYRTLEEAQARIRSISLIHETLYASNDFGDMDFSEYAASLAGEILAPAGGWTAELELHMEPLRLTLTEAIPCGLILNEMLTNVRKYAFPPEWPGARRVELGLRRGPDGWAELRVRDTGIGIPDSLDLEQSASLGCTIMRLLAQQLGGELSLEDEEGFVVTLRFPRPGAELPDEGAEQETAGGARI